jgi:hypothetical protein
MEASNCRHLASLGMKGLNLSLCRCPKNIKHSLSTYNDNLSSYPCLFFELSVCHGKREVKKMLLCMKIRKLLGMVFTVWKKYFSSDQQNLYTVKALSSQ